MITHIKGILIDITPSYVVIDVNGIGYFIKISLNTYSKLEGHKNIFIYTHLIFREDKCILYGFYNKNERYFFRHLISVNGIGANIAIIILSSLHTDEIGDAIIHNKEEIFKSVKGIGKKTAKRILIDLKDKINNKDFITQNNNLLLNTSLKNEALNALLHLGFSSKKKIEPIIDKIIIKNPSISIENLIKKVLKIL